VSARRLSPRVRVAAAIERLPESHRLALALRLVDRFSTLEAAGALELTAHEVESRFASALESIAGELGAPARRSA
jgi:DNA-directed RNA polymerase specialized sigma24 family protein